MQRFFDIFFSGVALILLSPLLIPVIISLRLTGEGEIFFKQKRVGKDGKYIDLYKFATMLKDSPNIGTGTVTLHNDPRILPFGGWLRKTKINELPQLINIFKGDMSVIGPRPQTERCFQAFPEKAQKSILKVRPGLSGVGSIVFRNEEEMMHKNEDPELFYDKILMPYKGDLEIWYVENSSITNYFFLIAITAFSVITKSNMIIFKYFPSLPSIPVSLEKHLNRKNYE